MKPKVFLDTNILLDLFLERPGFEDASRILQAGEDGKIILCCSFLTMANLAFILRKSVSSARLVPTLFQISSLIHVLPMDKDQLADAYCVEGRDFEDILQAVCANKGGCSYIITRNVAHFHFTSLKEHARNISSFHPALSPSEFLKRFECQY